MVVPLDEPREGVAPDDAPGKQHTPPHGLFIPEFSALLPSAGGKSAQPAHCEGTRREERRDRNEEGMERKPARMPSYILPDGLGGIPPRPFNPYTRVEGSSSKGRTSGIEPANSMERNKLDLLNHPMHAPAREPVSGRCEPEIRRPRGGARGSAEDPCRPPVRHGDGHRS